VSVLVEYSVILVIVYLISRFILFPILERQITREERHRENRSKHTREIIDTIEDIKQILWYYTNMMDIFFIFIVTISLAATIYIFYYIYNQDRDVQNKILSQTQSS